MVDVEEILVEVLVEGEQFVEDVVVLVEEGGEKFVEENVNEGGVQDGEGGDKDVVKEGEGEVDEKKDFEKLVIFDCLLEKKDEEKKIEDEE